jgi:hypothetical protein
MNESFSVYRRARRQTPYPELMREALNVLTRIVQAESEQNRDETRLDDVTANSEREIAALDQRHLGPEERAKVAIRDKTALLVRDVRRNMLQRTIAAKRMLGALGEDFLSKCSRFAEDDNTDRDLRIHFCRLLESVPTFALMEHYREAVKANNLACAEMIRFEFQCRDDREKYFGTFQTRAATMAGHDPVAMRKRLANICRSIERADSRLTNVLPAGSAVRTTVPAHC